MKPYSHREFSEDARASLQREIAQRWVEHARHGRRPHVTVTVGSVVPVWVLGPRARGGDDLEVRAKHNGSWHIQVHHEGSARHFAHAEPSTDAQTGWRLRATFFSEARDSLAVPFQQALEWVGERYELEQYEVRLLVAPSYHLHALWIKGARDEHVILLDMPQRYRHDLQLKHAYPAHAFLEALAKIRPVTGFVNRPPRRRNIRTWMHGNAWGALTIALAAVVAGCGAVFFLSDQSAAWGPAGQWLTLEGLVLGLFVWAGFLSRRRPAGILIDDRNRISLGRFQWVMWVVLIFGAYFVAAIWSLALKAPMPTLTDPLLKLLALVSASPVVGNVILDSKKATGVAPGAGALQPLSSALPPAAAPPGVPDQIGSVDRNVTAAEASWADLYLGEEVANRNVVDVGRLQQLMFTLLLGVIFANELWATLGHVVFPLNQGAALPIPIPQPGTDWLWMLGISHGAYLAQKAAPKAAAPGA